MLDALPVAIYTTDAAGRITFYNQAAADLAGRRPELGKDEWCVTWRLYWPDGTPMRHEQCPMAVAIREDREVRGERAVAERPDGGRVPFMPYPTPLRDEAGRVVGAVNCWSTCQTRSTRRSVGSKRPVAAGWRMVSTTRAPPKCCLRWPGNTSPNCRPRGPVRPGKEKGRPASGPAPIVWERMPKRHDLLRRCSILLQVRNCRA